MEARKKKQRTNPTDGFDTDFFDRLPDDLVISILCKLSSTAPSPSDFLTVLLTCKRMKRLGLNPLVLRRAGSKALAIRAINWSDQAHGFLKRCVTLGNVQACYILGMIRFYCLENRPGGLSLMAKAALRSHPPALYSLGVIHFNGSGAPKSDKDLRAGVAFFARASSLGHVDALRELGHCLQDGYGINRNVQLGHRFLIEANLRELAHKVRSVTTSNPTLLTTRELRDHNSTELDPHPANKFLVEWFASREIGPGLILCSNPGCGRPETRSNEFRRCAACGKANYCSRGCQVQDWKVRHKVDCVHVED